MLDRASIYKLKHNPSLYPRRFGINVDSPILDANLATKQKNHFKIHLHGAPNVGKTSIALFYARYFSNPFYIDFGDLRNSFEAIQNMIFKISMEKKVDLLILDNIPREWNLFPAMLNIISINERATQKNDFVNKAILPLNFTEFISFDKSAQNITQLLDTFIKDGNLPINARDKLEQKQKMLFLSFHKNLEIFLYLCALQGKIVSINQIYVALKKKIKTSKDSIYAFLADLLERGILYLVPHFENKNAPKKVFLWDFSIPNVTSYERDFVASFANMLFLELLDSNKPIFYGDKIHLICDNVAYIVAPFSTREGIKSLIENIISEVKMPKIVVITLDIEDEFSINDKQIIVQNFIHFALKE